MLYGWDNKSKGTANFIGNSKALMTKLIFISKSFTKRYQSIWKYQIKELKILKYQNKTMNYLQNKKMNKFQKRWKSI